MQTASVPTRRPPERSWIFGKAVLKTLRKSTEESIDPSRVAISTTNPFSHITTLSDAFACITEICNTNGYDHFFLAYLEEIGNHVDADDIVLTNFPLYVVDDLVALKLLADWSVLKHLQHTSAPFSWTPAGDGGSVMISGDPTSNIDAQPGVATDFVFIDELETTFAHCFQPATRNQRRAYMVLCSSEQSEHVLDPAVINSIQLIFDKIEKLSGERRRNASLELNKRELECLNWAAAGKTSGEIALIVTLSEHTVNHYLNACCKKLDSVNRTQAVAKAVRLGIIR